MWSKQEYKDLHKLVSYVLINRGSFGEAVNCTTVRASFNSHGSFVNQTFRFGTCGMADALALLS